MPFINGRFYINPTFGRAVEFARANEAEQEGAEHQEHRPAHHRRHGGHGDNYDAATTPEGVANQIYNETSGLRTTDRSGNGPGSDWNLQQARFAMAHVIQNRAASGIRGGLASDEINSPQEAKAIRRMGSKAYDAHGESVYAAHRAGKQPDPTGGAKHFYLEYGQGPPKYASGRIPIAVFGPFSNPTGKRDAVKDKDVTIIVLPGE
jgi:hypothetical protein